MQHKVFAVAFLAIAASGCYHAVVDTGLAPSTQVVDVPWASGFVDGLVPPSTVETAAKCPHGVAKVETQHSFLNMVAQVLTLGIYTPMQITVTCAATGAMAAAQADISGPDARNVVTRAANQSAATGQPVTIEISTE